MVNCIRWNVIDFDIQQSTVDISCGHLSIVNGPDDGV